jgi:hypothetical protein
MNETKSIRKQNELLRTLLLSGNSGHYRWIWSEDPLLTQPMLVLGPDGKPTYDLLCVCGKNVSVHLSTCKLSIPQPRWTRRRVLPFHRDQWVMCKWLPPPPRDAWDASLPGVPYPEGGYYAPVGDASKTVCLKPGLVPQLHTTLMLIDALKAQIRRSAQDDKDEVEEALGKKKKDARNTLEAQVRDRLTFNLGNPGEKGDFSFGGFPDTPSPNLRRSDLPIQKAGKDIN